MTIYICDGYWKSNPELGTTEIEPFTNMRVSDDVWDGVESVGDTRIFYYTEHEAIVGDHGEFVLTTATEE